MNITVPENITIPEQTIKGQPLGYYSGFKEGYQAGFKYAIGAFQDFITVIFVACIAFWVVRIVMNRLEFDGKTVDLGFTEWHITPEFFKEATQQIYFTIILAVSGFMLYWMIF